MKKIKQRIVYCACILCSYLLLGLGEKYSVSAWNSKIPISILGVMLCYITRIKLKNSTASNESLFEGAIIRPDQVDWIRWRDWMAKWLTPIIHPPKTKNICFEKQGVVNVKFKPFSLKLVLYYNCSEWLTLKIDLSHSFVTVSKKKLFCLLLFCYGSLMELF